MVKGHTFTLEFTMQDVISVLTAFSIGVGAVSLLTFPCQDFDLRLLGLDIGSNGDEDQFNSIQF